MVEPDLVDTAYQPLSKAWKRAKLINIKAIKGVTSGRVEIIDSEGNNRVLLADGIIVATGAMQSSTLIKDVQGKSKDSRKAEFIAFRDAVKNSKAGVLVIGGGTTGVELVAEIATDFTNVKCTLVNKPQLLLSESYQRWYDSMFSFITLMLEHSFPLLCIFRWIGQEIRHAQYCVEAAG